MAKRFLTGVQIDITDINPDSEFGKIAARIFNEAFKRDQAANEETVSAARLDEELQMKIWWDDNSIA